MKPSFNQRSYVAPRFVKNDEELVATVTSEKIPQAQAASEAGGQGDENLIALDVTVSVIDFFEPINITHAERQLPLLSSGFLDGLPEPLIDHAAVVEPRQGINASQSLHFLGLSAHFLVNGNNAEGYGNAGPHFVGIEGFTDKVVTSAFKGFSCVIEAGNHENVRDVTLIEAANLCRDLDTGKAWHLVVEENQIRPFFRDDSQGFRAIGSLNDLGILKFCGGTIPDKVSVETAIVSDEALQERLPLLLQFSQGRDGWPHAVA